MKNILKKIILPLLLISLISCNEEEFFKLDHSPEFPYNNLTSLERSVIGLYHKGFSQRDWENPWVNHVILRESVGDHVGFVDNPEWDYTRDLQDATRYTMRSWVYFYQIINSANFTLNYLKENNWDPYPDISSDDREYNLNRIIGELYFMRGWAYYHLALMHCPAYDETNTRQTIPLRVNYTSNVEEAIYPKIGTVKEVYDQLVEDFIKAKEYLPEKYLDGIMHPSYQAGRANKFAAAAMLARVYMQMHDYEKAEDECDFVIDENGGLYDLSEDPIEAFNKSSIERGKEVIMYAACFDELDNAEMGFFHLSVLNHRVNGGFCRWVETHMSEPALKEIGWQPDPMNDSTITDKARSDKRFQQLFAVREPFRPPLLQNDTSAYYETRTSLNYRTIVADRTERGPNERYTNYPLLRLSEFYLTRSVCRFRNSDLQGAADDLNVVKERAWDENAGGAFQPVLAADLTEDMINDERMIEMFAEGDRMHYLRALKEDLPPGERIDEPNRAWDDPEMVWAIPNEELLLNGSYDISGE